MSYSPNWYGKINETERSEVFRAVYETMPYIQKIEVNKSMKSIGKIKNMGDTGALEVLACLADFLDRNNVPVGKEKEALGV